MIFGTPSTGRTHSGSTPCVVQIIDRLNVGGPTPYVCQITRGLKRLGYTAHLTRGRVARGESEMVEVIRDSGVEPIDIPELGRSISPWKDACAFHALYRLLRETRPQLVHTHKSKAGVLGRFAARLAGVPVVVHSFHGHPFHGYFSRWQSALIVIAERLLAHATDTIVAVSRQQREELLQYRVAPRSRIQAIPLGFDLSPFLDPQRVDSTFRADIGCPPDAPLVGVVGRLAPIKAIDQFLKAARIVADRIPDVRFVIVGDGECRSDLEALAAELEIEHQVTFAGFRRDVDRIYAALDLTVLSSYNEGMPVSLIEAISSGCYVVSTRVGGVEDLVDTDGVGVTVPPGQPDDLAEAVVDALDRKCQVSEPHRRRVGYQYGIDRLMSDLSRLYERLLLRANVRKVPDVQVTGG